jgi:multiple sugar transport system permease protein
VPALTLSDDAFKWVLITPAVLVVVLLLLFPFAFTLAVSFTDWHLFAWGSPISFAGLEFWKKVLTSDYVHTTVLNTLRFVLFAVPVEFAIGLAVALALNEATRGRQFFRVFFLLPIMISPVAVSFIIGSLMLNEDIGPITHILVSLGLERIHFLSDPKIAPWSIVAVDVWQSSSFMILMFLAGLQSLPQEPYEAAIVDGSNALQRFRYITLPLLAPVMITATLIRGLGAFQVMDIIFVLTGGGPGQSTESISMTVYRMGVKGGDFAFGAASSYLLLLSMLVFTVLVMGVLRRRVPDVSV